VSGHPSFWEKMHQSNGRQVENEVSINFILREGLALSLFLVPAGCASFDLSLAFPVMVPAIDHLLDFCGLRHCWLQQQLCSQIMLGPTKPKDLGAWSYPLLGNPSSNQISKVDMIMAAITQSTILDHVAALTVRHKKAWAIGCPKPKPKWWLPICWSLFSPLPVGSQYNLGVFLFQFRDIESLVKFFGKRKENKI
jgi:hypothetical protein